MLRNIYISAYSADKKIDTVDTEEIIIEDSRNFWAEIAEIAITAENTEEIACWYCGLFFTSKAWGIPIFTLTKVVTAAQPQYAIHHNFPEGVTKQELSTVSLLGSCCSIFCANRLLEESVDIPPSAKDTYRKLLYFAYSQHVGKKIKHIPLAPSRHLMKIYCGPKGISEQEYRERNRALEAEIF